MSDLCTVNLKIIRLVASISFSFNIFLSGCMVDSLKNDPKSVFFSLKEFAHLESASLQKMNLTVLKKAAKNKENEQQILSNLDWENELAPIAESDINRPAWKSQYAVDSLEEQNTLNVSYTALNNELPIKKIRLSFDKQSRKFQSLIIDKSSENFLYSSWQKIYYERGGKLHIYGQLSMYSLLNNEYATELVVIETKDIVN